MIKLFSTFNFGFTIRRSDKDLRPGWNSVFFKFDINEPFRQVRHFKTEPNSVSSYQINDQKWTVKKFLFLKETEYHNDQWIKRYSTDLNLETGEWEVNGSSSKSPTPQCRFYCKTYYLPFTALTVSYYTDYGVQKTKEFELSLNKGID